ncbi:MAG: hypothetical protein ACYTG5_19385 [Planctomycetota bacterium]|jgi:hypothetical protein
MNLARLRKQWGNEDWAAEDHYIEKALSLLDETQGPILECGSGLTTLALTPHVKGRSYHVLEHDFDWMMKLIPHIFEEADAPHLHHTPIEGGWYADPIPEGPFGLVICDGPPSGLGQRGMLPARANLAPGCVVLLDDANREPERRALLVWTSVFGARLEKVSSEGRGWAQVVFEEGA